MFKSAEISNFAPNERQEYIKDMTTERDIKNQMDFAVNKGREEQRLADARKYAKEMLVLGIDPSRVSSITGLTLEEIHHLS